MDKFKKNLEVLYTLIGDKKVVSASSIKFGGVSEAITKMTLGNRIGAEFNNLNKEELFGLNYGSILLEVNKDVNIEEEFKACTFKIVGETIAETKIKSKDFDLEFVIEDLDKN